MRPLMQTHIVMMHLPFMLQSESAWQNVLLAPITEV
jgi:hypothetical protein